jgi:Protein of unknown function (DUF2934)
MAKSQGKRASNLVTLPTVEAFAVVTGREIAVRAYELYEQRGREHGRDLDDWLQAERELRHALRSTAA